jgi:hypothetical protein
MNAIRIETTIDSDTLHLPQLKPLLGKSVEIIVREMTQVAKQTGNGVSVSLLVGSVIEYRDPLEPAAMPEDWEAIR